MSKGYYKPCREFDRCNELIERYFKTQQYEKCFEGHMSLAEQGYPLAECQIGYFYSEGLGVEKDLKKAVYWTRRAADHGDRDGQYNLASFCEEAVGTERDTEQAHFWYKMAAKQGHTLAIEKCRELGIDLSAAELDREEARKELRCRIFPFDYLQSRKFTVICTYYNGKWVLSRHKNVKHGKRRAGISRPAKRRLNARKGNFLRRAGLRRPTFTRCATTGVLIHSPAQTERSSLLWLIQLGRFRKAKCGKQNCLKTSPPRSPIRTFRRYLLRRLKKC